jgi:four helix bundle protein
MNTKADFGTGVAGPRVEHRFFALDLALEIARDLVGPLAALKAKDRHLWDQAYRSWKDAGLAIAEGGKRRKLDRAYFFDTAAGSMREMETALRLAVTFGVFEAGVLDGVAPKVDRLLGMLWKLGRRAEADVAAAKRRR